MADSNLKSRVLEDAAVRLGLPVTRLDHYVLEVTIGGRPHQFLQMCGPTSSAAAKYLCDHKDLTRLLLTRAGLTINEGATFAAAELEQAVAYAQVLGYPVVVKPTSLSRARGVTLGIDTAEGVREAGARALASVAGSDNERFLVERQFAGGTDYRFFVVGDRVVGVIRRVAAYVVGDGVATLLELIQAKNALRAARPFYAERLIPDDVARLGRLKRLGIALSSVPASGERVQLQDATNAGSGGENVDATEAVHPRYLQLALAAIAAIPGMRYGGVDMFARDFTTFDEGDAGAYAIGEVEFSPAPGPLFVMEGVARDVGRAVLEFYLDRAAQPSSHGPLHPTATGDAGRRLETPPT